MDRGRASCSETPNGSTDSTTLIVPHWWYPPRNNMMRMLKFVPVMQCRAYCTGTYAHTCEWSPRTSHNASTHQRQRVARDPRP